MTTKTQSELITIKLEKKAEKEKVRGVERRGKRRGEGMERMVLDAVVIINYHPHPHLWMARRKTHTTQS